MAREECHNADPHRPDAILDYGILPHAVIRVGIRRQLAQRLAEIRSSSLGSAYERKMDYIERLRTRPIAIETATANTQHYEVRLSMPAPPSGACSPSSHWGLGVGGVASTARDSTSSS